MPENAIIVENLSKQYLIGHRLTAQREHNYTALRDVIGREVENFVRKATDVFRGRQVVQGDVVEEFWALKNVNFQVKQGEVLGIIGLNGAGKSTLLKILSRITEPTEGRIVLSGRVASLLEVGTGFHPELTGRENVFLNGAILGMTKQEIRRKFDEIVAFADVGKFLDTPVKHYSSGMYVRLAFAVAAHLEPEILVVDEVLAVGDAEFHKKCLGKMDEVSRGHGRTVLFVSHNMEAVLRLCKQAILLQSGCVRNVGDAKTVVTAYLQSQSSSPRVIDLSSKARPDHFKGKARLAKVSPSDENSSWSVPFGQRLSLDLSIDTHSTETQIGMIITVSSARGFGLATWTNLCSDVELPVRPGMNTFRIGFQHMDLLPGQYVLGIGVRDSRDNDDWNQEAVLFEITSSPKAAKINADSFPGAFILSATVSILD
jgi:ABC-type polysaccharide/polyol phosphate transport system ATPase subunit